ncbi:MAG: hypothetical protein WCY11_04470 [Novosphingobium sp.]
MRLLGALALADVGTIFGAGFGSLATPWAGVIHLALTAAAMGRLSQGHRVAGWNALACSLGAVAGPCGIFLLYALRPWSACRQPGILRAKPSQEKEGPDRKVAALVAQLVDQRLRFPKAASVVSLATILRHGDLASRCQALETAVRSFEPRLSPLIAAALCDSDQTVRALAAATSAQISASLTDRIARMTARPALSIEEDYELAMHLFEHGMHNVLLSQAQRSILRGQARSRLVQLQRNPACLGHRATAVTNALGQLGIDRAQAVPAAQHPDKRHRATG